MFGAIHLGRYAADAPTVVGSPRDGIDGVRSNSAIGPLGFTTSAQRSAPVFATSAGQWDSRLPRRGAGGSHSISGVAVPLPLARSRSGLLLNQFPTVDPPLTSLATRAVGGAPVTYEMEDANASRVGGAKNASSSPLALNATSLVRRAGSPSGAMRGAAVASALVDPYDDHYGYGDSPLASRLEGGAGGRRGFNGGASTSLRGGRGGGGGYGGGTLHQFASTERGPLAKIPPLPIQPPQQRQGQGQGQGQRQRDQQGFNAYAASDPYADAGDVYSTAPNRYAAQAQHSGSFGATRRAPPQQQQQQQHRRQYMQPHGKAARNALYGQGGGGARGGGFGASNRGDSAYGPGTGAGASPLLSLPSELSSSTVGDAYDTYGDGYGLLA